MLGFYYIDNEYIKYLQKFDDKVPNVGYSSHNKFVCGTVLKVNDVDYYVPLSSNKNIYRTSLPIKIDGQVIATLRFSFMFPANKSVLQFIDFNEVAKKDFSYSKLLEKEWRFCISNEQKILNKANKIYKIGCNPNHQFYSLCCDFIKLEAAAKEYRV